MKKLLIRAIGIVVAIVAGLILGGCTATPTTHTSADNILAPTPAPVPTPKPPAALACPACKVIIDYSALQSAAADLEKAAYGAWVAVRVGLDSGAFTWDEVGPLAYEVCEWADELRERTAKMEKEIRELAERKPKP